MKQFDEQFSQKAKEAFSGYDAGHLADAGWNSFIQKRRRRGIAGIIIPMWAKAASVAILLTTGSLITYRMLDTRPATSQVGEMFSTMAEETPSLPSVRGEQSVPAMTEPEPSAIDERGAAGRRVEVPQLAINAKSERGIAERITSERSTSERLTTERAAAGVAVLNPVFASDTMRRAEAMPAVSEVTIAEAKDAAAALMVDVDRVIVTEQLAEALPDEVTERTRKTFLMAGMSGNMAREEDISSGAPGVSFGVYGERRLSRRWAVRPGVVLAMHSVGLGSPAVESSLNYVAPALDGASGSVESFDGRLNMLAVEVPVNMVYTILERGKKGLYVSVGASTMVYLAQNVSGSFTNSYTRESYNASTGLFSSVTIQSSVSVESSEEPFSHTDVFGLANFSAGYTMPFGKSSRLLIEPYVQLPVNTLTSLNLRIRYGGLAFKIRFGK